MPIQERNSGPLAGLRVLELGHFIAGPFCTRLMADQGADVIKVERPGKGDPVRDWGEMLHGSSIWWSVHGRNKRSITVNIKSGAGLGIIQRLVRDCDILVENYRPGQLEKWGFSSSELEKLRPGLVLVRISGYGQTGPDKDRAAFGVIGEAIGGLRRLTGFPKGVTDLPPARTGVSLGDSVAALYGAFGALAAYRAQQEEGGTSVRVVDVALTESVLSLTEGCIPEFDLLGKIRQPAGSTLPTNAPSNAYRCSDEEYVLIAANSDQLFQALCNVMDRTELVSDARFLTNSSRCEHADELDAEIQAWAGPITSDEAVEILRQADIPSTKIYDISDCVNDRQFREREMITKVEDPNFGSLLQPAPLPKFGGGQGTGSIRWPGPAVGEHTRQILTELGYGPDEVNAFVKDGVV